MPYYIGLRQLGSTLGPVVMSVARAVHDAESIILRLPGVIGSIGAAICVGTRRRYSVEVVGDPREVLAAGVLGAGRLLASAAAGYLRWAVRGADAVLYATTATLQSRYPARPGAVSTGMANVVLGPEAFASQPRRHPAGRADILAIGSHEQHYKGHDVLLRAVRRLLDDGVDVNATIVGGGRAHVDIQRVVGSLGLGEHVVLTGAIDDRARLVALLDEATVFVMPSRTEGLPRALVEAMAQVCLRSAAMSAESRSSSTPGGSCRLVTTARSPVPSPTCSPARSGGRSSPAATSTWHVDSGSTTCVDASRRG